MAKKIRTILKLEINGGEANPSPPLGPILGQNAINIGEFTKRFNEMTKDKKGYLLNVRVLVYEDRTFDIIVKTPKTSDLIKKFAKVEAGSKNSKKEIVGSLTLAQVQEIAKLKLPDLNTADLDQAIKIVTATAKNMGIEVKR